MASKETPVYQDTTKPKKPKRRNKSDLGKDFVAPDGGWGWVVCLAAGFSNLSIFPTLQQYGLIYKQRLYDLGFEAKHITTIINVLMATSSLVGIINGAMFRRFTFRQVALVGSFLCFLGIFLSAFCSTLPQFLLWFSCIYGVGLGLTLSATSLAVNTYFKNRRRRATGFSWTITGLGPIIFPQISILLLVTYGAQGTIIVYAAIALNSILCAITLQPVLRHVRKKSKDPQSNEQHPQLTMDTNVQNDKNDKNVKNIQNGLLMILNNGRQHSTNGQITQTVTNTITNNANNNNTQNGYLLSENEYFIKECKYCQIRQQQSTSRSKKRHTIFSSQYLFNSDDPERPGYEITEPGTPMLSQANDGWFGSKLSLSSNNKYLLNNHSQQQQQQQQQLIKDHNVQYQQSSISNNSLFKPNYFNREKEDYDNEYSSKLSINSKQDTNELLNYQCICNNDKSLMQMIPTQDQMQIHHSSQQPKHFNIHELDVKKAYFNEKLHLNNNETIHDKDYDYHSYCDKDNLNNNDAKNPDSNANEDKDENEDDDDDKNENKISFSEKVVKFFDLDLLKDFTFVNLAMGMTIMLFGEINFSILTPFILGDLGYTNQQISLVMSILGGMDISVRFLAPFALEKVKLNNRILFAFGIISISMGRILVTLTNSYYFLIVVFILIGFGKGFRTIFSPLIIPSYVPLHRLPAASGLQLIFNSVFSFSFGPIIGIISDSYGYKTTIHFINFLTFTALILWSTESTIRRFFCSKPRAKSLTEA